MVAIMKFLYLTRFLFLLSLSLCALCAYAQTYPSKVVKVIVPSGTSGTMDLLGREFALAFNSQLGKPFIVENKAGAGGNIGMGLLARAPADGYTIGLGAANALAANPFLYSSVPFDSQKDFAPIAFIGRMQFVLVAQQSVPADNYKDLIALMKSKKSNFNFGSSGVGNTAHLFGELLKQRAGVEMEHIPFKSSGEAIQELVAGRIQLQFASPAEVMPQIRRGLLKPIAVASASRVDSLPQTPTLAELGLPGFESPTWFGILAPAGTPKEIVSLLNQEAKLALQQANVKTRLAQAGVEPDYMTPEQFKVFIAEEMKRWEMIVKQSGARLN
jgi:tripartite-type tricarboxylate transporter receptor subunit TctC